MGMKSTFIIIFQSMPQQVIDLSFLQRNEPGTAEFNVIFCCAGLVSTRARQADGADRPQAPANHGRRGARRATGDQLVPAVHPELGREAPHNGQDRVHSAERHRVRSDRAGRGETVRQVVHQHHQVQQIGGVHQDLAGKRLRGRRLLELRPGHCEWVVACERSATRSDCECGGGQLRGGAHRNHSKIVLGIEASPDHGF